MQRPSVRSIVVALAGAALALAPSLVRAQDLPRLPRRGFDAAEPDYWVGLSIGYVDGVTLTDAGTGNTWQFGYSPQIRATVEKKIQRGITAGISAGYSTAPLTYTSNGFDSGCFGSCAAKADITQYLVFIRGGGSTGFHGLYSLEAGATSFSNFRENDNDAQLSPTSATYDFTFGFGGGVGYGISPTSEVYVGESLDIVLHSQGSTGTATTAPRLFTFRGGVRIGF